MLLTLISVAFGQMYEGNPCTAWPDLRDQLHTDQIGGFAGQGPDFREGGASSMLAPSGSPPVPACDSTNNTPEECAEAALLAKDRWSCTYGSPQAADGDPKTAWVEGANGLGEGEVLLVRVDPSQPLEIWAGYGKSDSLFGKNARPREVEVAVIQNGQCTPTQSTLICDNNPIVARHTVTLEDKNGYQPLPIPAASGDAIAIRILSVTPGSAWQDTCISEVRNAP